MNRGEKPPKRPIPDDELLDAVTEESGYLDSDSSTWISTDSESPSNIEEYKHGKIVGFQGRRYYILREPYKFKKRLVIDVVPSNRDLINPRPGTVMTIPLESAVITRRSITHVDREYEKRAGDPNRHGLPLMTAADVRYSKMTPERQRQIAEDPVFAQYVDKYPYGAKIYCDTIPCIVWLSPYKDKVGKIMVKIKSDNKQSAGFSTKVVPVEDIILRSEVV